MLHVTRRAVWFVGGDQYSAGFFVYAAVVAEATCRSRCVAVGGSKIDRLVTTETPQSALRIASDSRHDANAQLVNRMKLFVAPRLIVLGRQALDRYFLARPLLIVEPWPDPFAVRYRI